MNKVSIELDSNGIKELLQSEDVATHVEELANQIRSKCSGNYEVDTQKGKYRSQTRISTADDATFYKNLNGNELLKALR